MFIYLGRGRTGYFPKSAISNWGDMIEGLGFVHNYLWLISKPEHTEECLCGGEWLEMAVAWECCRPFYNNCNQSVEQDRREMLISSEGLHSTEQYFTWHIALVLAVKVSPLTSPNQSCSPPSSSTLFCPANVLGVENDLVWSGWAVWILHIASSQWLGSSKQNNKQKSSLSSDCQGCLVQFPQKPDGLRQHAQRRQGIFPLI